MQILTNVLAILVNMVEHVLILLAVSDVNAHLNGLDSRAKLVSTHYF